MSDKPTIALSANENENYSFGIVLAAASWRALGYPVSAATLETTPGLAPVVESAAAAMELLGVRVTRARSDNQPSTADAKVARYDLACSEPGVAVISDADMIRFAPLPELPPLDDSTIWSQGANLYDNVPRFRGLLPACYLAATGAAWAKIKAMQADASYAAIFELDGNVNDERAVLRGIRAAGLRVIKVGRTASSEGIAMGRIERRDWGTMATGLSGGKIKRIGWIDGHLPRPAWRDDEWPYVRAVCCDLCGLPSATVAILDAFREHYAATVAAVQKEWHSQ